MKALITGAAGFIGSHLVDGLIAAGWDVGGVDDLSGGSRDHLHPDCRFWPVDITGTGLEAVFADHQPDVVFHQAAQVDVSRSVADPSHDARLNILGSLAVLDLCRRYAVRKVVFASSAAVYGDPLRLPIDEDHPVHPMSPYGASKLAVEHYLQVYRALHGLAFTVLRYANVYGPRQDAAGEGGVVAIFARCLRTGEQPVIFGDGEQTRDFVYVGDVAAANMAAAERGDGRVLNVSGGREITVNHLYDRMAAAAGVDARPRREQARAGDIRRSVLANDRARTALAWEPTTSLDTGLQAVLSG